MRKLHSLSKVALASTMLLTAGTGLTLAIDRNNEDEVVKIDARMSRYDCRPNEVLVKFKPSSAVKMRANKAGKYASAGVSGVDAVMQKLGADRVEQLMPLTGKDLSRKMSKSYSGVPVLNADLSKLYRITFDAKKVQSVHEAVEMLRALDEVEFAEPNYLVYSTSTEANGNGNGNGNGNSNSDLWESEPLYSEQWGIQEVNLHHLWKQTPITTDRPIIGIIDTGVDIEHPDLADNIWTNPSENNGAEDSDDDSNGFIDDLHGWDFINNTGRIGDWNGHGTHCAGTAAGVGVNGKGVAGANPDALIMPVTVLQSDGVGDLATLIKGIDYAVANGADVISMSLGTYAESIALEQSLAKAYQKAVLVAAAGNDGICIYPHRCPPPNGQLGSPSFPAAYTFVLGVQASDKYGITSWSNFDEDGPIYCNPTYFGEEKLYNYELTAPGQTIISTFINGQYKKLNGTSMATPLVAGAISRLITCKDYSNKEILFGDLIHSTTKNGNVDFFAAYSITDEDRQPTLHHVTNLIDDVEGGDGDSRPDAGETIRLYPTLRNDWGNAMNIRITLEMGENEDETLIEFIENGVTFGNNLSSYAKGKSVNPIVFKLRDDVADGRHIKLRLRATCDNISKEMVQDFVITAENGVEIGGMIDKDLTLYPNVHYIVTKQLVVLDGVKLTILPGTVIKFKDGTYLSLSKNAILDCVGEPGNMITFTSSNNSDNGISIKGGGSYLENGKFDYYHKIKYCKIEGIDASGDHYIIFNLHADNCIFNNNISQIFIGSEVSNSNIINSTHSSFNVDYNNGSYKRLFNMGNNNFANNYSYSKGNTMPFINSNTQNLFVAEPNNYLDYDNSNGYDYNSIISFGYYSQAANIYYTNSYFGTSREDIARERILDLENPFNPVGVGKVDLSNMLTRPAAEAHGIVWKVVVNGYDAQDEYELLPPLGVGKHKFEVYFNRPMNKAKAPMIAMGVRPPYTQTAISEEGAWNEEGTIYTAYLTIDGKSNCDGVNRIYVAEAEDDEFFDIPIEDYRFNVNVQSAGSLSTGLMAEAGLGKVNLTWETDEEDFEDLLGYNIVRYTEHVDSIYEKDYSKYGDYKNHLVIKGDTITVNKTLIDSKDQAFTDFDVVPGTTYYYRIKQLTTSMNSYDLSNVVAATPLTATKGDANGSMSVDVADVVTEVAYMTNQNPQPFIFEAADVNADLAVNVLDVVGTVNIIRNPKGASSMSINSTATYTIEDGILYVDSDVALGGVQFRIEADEDAAISALEALSAFELVKDYDAENGWLVMAYSMTGKTVAIGKQALLRIGDAKVTEAIFSDSKGQNVMAICGDTSGVGSVEAMQMQMPYPNPFSDVLNIPYVIGQEGSHKVSIQITTPSGLRIASHNATREFGYYNYTWRPTAGNDEGIYFVSLYVDDRLMQTARVILRR